MITPTPWQAGETVIFKGQSALLQMEINSDIRTAKDNCAFVVKAVNNHHDLVMAITRLRKAFFVDGTTKALKAAFADTHEVLKKALE